MFAWLSCLLCRPKKKGTPSVFASKGSQQRKQEFDNVFPEEPKAEPRPSAQAAASKAASSGSLKPAGLSTQFRRHSAPPPGSVPRTAAEQISAEEAAQEEEAEKIRAIQSMQRHYRGKLGRAKHEAERERKVMMSNKVRVTMGGEDGEEITHINDYAMDKVLGQGAYGIVYKARGGEHGEVAVKVLNRSVLAKKKQGAGTALDGVFKEIGVMKKLQHPNCVQLWEVIDDPAHNHMYLVMEFIEGGDLAAPISRKEHISEERMRVWMRDAVVGLEYLHSYNILHRDIKPENILWDARAEVAKLADFGVSDLAEGGHKDYVRATAGTPAFYAPEMCGDDKTGVNVYSGRAADVWALGVCLYMWMYHKLPFEAPTVYMLMQEIAGGELVLPGTYEASPELAALCEGLLEKKPRKRLRLKDLRRDHWMTAGHAHPLPVPQHQGAAHSSVVRSELREILLEGMMQLRGTNTFGSVSNTHKETGERFHEKTKQVVVAPKKEQARPTPRGPGMLKRAK